jgi:hypothetical protein
MSLHQLLLLLLLILVVMVPLQLMGQVQTQLLPLLLKECLVTSAYSIENR